MQKKKKEKFSLKAFDAHIICFADEKQLKHFFNAIGFKGWVYKCSWKLGKIGVSMKLFGYP